MSRSIWQFGLGVGFSVLIVPVSWGFLPSAIAASVITYLVIVMIDISKGQANQGRQRK
jgi:hypothetical protein